MHPSKRPRASPTGLTPTQRFKRHVQHSDSASRRRLFEQPSACKSDSTEAVAGTRSTVSIRAIEVVKNPARSRLYPPSLSSVWSPTEDETLTQFMLLSTTGDIWSSTKSTKFWEGAATFLKNKAGTKRTSGACRTRVNKVLSVRFRSPLVAEKFFQGGDENTVGAETVVSGGASRVLVAPSVSSQGEERSSVEDVSSTASINVMTVDTLSELFDKVAILETDQHLQALSDMFSTYCSQVGLDVPSDFIRCSVQGMQHLSAAGRTNFLYTLAKGLGTKRSDGDDCVFPVKQLIAGLFEYSANFFVSTHKSQVACPTEYRLWLESMYSLFGRKWLNMHCGPMWKVETTNTKGLVSLPRSQVIEDARVNIPALSVRTLQRDIASSSFTVQAGIQESVLDEACKALPDERWWIKSDGCDVVTGLTESVRGEWGGDVDLGDGEMVKRYGEYSKLISTIKSLCRQLTNPIERCRTLVELATIKKTLEGDLEFILTVIKKNNDQLHEKLCSGKKASDKDLFSLSWTIDELSRLNSEGREMYAELLSICDLLKNESTDVIQVNMARRLSMLQDKCLSFFRGISRHKRVAASHVLVTMISPSQRNKKPYAVPVSCIPYKGLSESKARSHINSVISQMKKRNMKVAGFVSNGEYNVFRLKGFTRPVSVLKLRSAARNKFTSTAVSTMEKMLTPKVDVDGSIVSLHPTPCMSTALLHEIHSWRANGASEDDVVGRLRMRCVPTGYTPHVWNSERSTETKEDKLRSILAQLEFQYQVLEYEKRGVPFRTHLYVPEVHPISGQEYHEREDDAHVLKRIATATRLGGPSELQLERFTEALEDPESGLTYPALTGQRKQSVRDAERLFSKQMLQFMLKKNYQFEADYIKVVLNWRRSSDERGLSQMIRMRFNYEMLNFLLGELMPWHRQQYDFSTLEVNRSLSGIRGLSRETLIALTTTIESREWMRLRCISEKIPLEHPRASSTDDVECFFSVLRSLVGDHFTSKAVMLEWRKICNEFAKRIDSKLPFFYYTATHDRFYEGEMQSFDVQGLKKSTSNPRNQRGRTVEQPGKLASGRASLIRTRHGSIRRQFHAVPTDMPPPPTATLEELISSEHAY